MLDWYEMPAHSSQTDLMEAIPEELIDEELFVLALFILARSPEFNTAPPDDNPESIDRRMPENNTGGERTSP